MRLSVVLWLPDRRRRDVDNCCKSICDALNGICYLDDSQVAQLIVERCLDRQRPRADISIEALSYAAAREGARGGGSATP